MARHDTPILRPDGAGQPPKRTRLIRVAAGCLVLLVLLACGGAAAYYFLVVRQTAPCVPKVPAPAIAAPTPSATGSHIIAFNSARSGKDNIYVLDTAQPETVIDLTKDGPGDDFSPAWSPDGQQIAFTALRSGVWRIYSMNADGSNLRQLTQGRDDALDPAWSPDGKQIAYATKVCGFFALEGLCNLQIFVMQADCSAPRQLTNGHNDNFNPKWSPDGQRISFQSKPYDPINNASEIYVVNADGTGSHRLLAQSMNAKDANWAPDGLELVFAGKLDPKGVFQIFTVSLQGTGLRQVTQTGSNETEPAFSPDGKQIVFVSHRTGSNNLFIMQADGSGQTHLTKTPADNNSPAWRPAP